ncbi:MAG: 50S ribosomal protein L25, partial [Halieaceae bacterium]|nr:50S ribosomal protein L25 [Halieaceae bacterium]
GEDHDLAIASITVRKGGVDDELDDAPAEAEGEDESAEEGDSEE